MTPDTFVTRGDTHALCQDVALAGFDSEGRAYAIISDGCSSAPASDLGARLLARAALLELQQERILSLATIVERAATMSRALELPPQCLDATLLIAHASAPDAVDIIIAGDGVLASRTRTGAVRWTCLEFPHNAPFYPSYLLNPRRWDAWLELTGGEATLKSSDAPARTTRAHPCFELTLNPTELQLIALLSDGATSFVQPRKTPTSLDTTSVPLDAVLARVLASRSLQGPFMTRRCRRFLSRARTQWGWSHRDDFSVAAIPLEPPHSEGDTL